MTAYAATRKQMGVPHAIQLMLRVVAAAILLWVVGNVLVAINRGYFSEAVIARPGLIVLAGSVYALGQLLRVVRLALLIGDARLSLRHLASLHLFTAGVVLGTPLRLGDAYRAIELGRTTGGTIMGFTYVWLERLLDASVILPLLLYAVSGGAIEAMRFVGIAFVTLLFVCWSLALVVLLPDNLRRVGTYLIRRHEGQWTIQTLRLIDDIRAVMRGIPVILRGKIPSLWALTLLIWLAELGSFTVATLSWHPARDSLGGLLAFLSQTIGGGTLPELLANAQSMDLAELAYLSGSQGPLAIFALIAAFAYARRSPRGRP